MALKIRDALARSNVDDFHAAIALTRRQKRAVRAHGDRARIAGANRAPDNERCPASEHAARLDERRSRFVARRFRMRACDASPARDSASSGSLLTKPCATAPSAPAKRACAWPVATCACRNAMTAVIEVIVAPTARNDRNPMTSRRTRRTRCSRWAATAFACSALAPTHRGSSARPHRAGRGCSPSTRARTAAACRDRADPDRAWPRPIRLLHG